MKIIQNERQYRAAEIQVQRLEGAIRSLPSDPAARPHVAPELQVLERDTIQDLVDELREQMAEFEALKEGTRTGGGARTLEELPRLLVAAREAAALSVRELAEQLGVSEPDLLAHEQSLYRSAQFSLILQAAEVLDINLRGRIDVTYPASLTWRTSVLKRLRGKHPFAIEQSLTPHD